MARSHSVVIGSDRHLVSGATATGRPNPSDEIEVTLKLRRKKLLPDLSRRPPVPMTRKQLAAKYGASSADITKVVKTLGRFGLKRVTSDPATRIVRLRGTIANMEKAFEVKLFNYTHENESYRGRVGPVHVPSELTKIVEAVFGLDNRRMVHRRRPPTVLTDHAKSESSSWYIPSELASHYGFPAGDGSGQTIGLLEIGGGYFPDDLKQFCAMAKLSAPPQVTVISTDGIPTNSKDGAEGEVMLDIKVAAGVCPKAQIAVYFAHFTEQGWVTVLDSDFERRATTKNNENQSV